MCHSAFVFPSVNVDIFISEMFHAHLKHLEMQTIIREHKSQIVFAKPALDNMLAFSFQTFMHVRSTVPLTHCGHPTQQIPTQPLAVSACARYHIITFMNIHLNGHRILQGAEET